MSNLAQEEADRFFSNKKERMTTHPEDRDDSSTHSTDNERSNTKETAHSEAGSDEDTLHNMATMTSTRTTYQLPTTVHYANTGPKGVIADAQSFARAKQTTFRKRLASIAGNLSLKANAPNLSEKKTDPNGSGSDSDLNLSEEENDSEFMKTWRANRLQELSLQSNQSTTKRRVSPSRRIWGALTEVDANGYLDAIEKVADDVIVVVMIFNPDSSNSMAVEDELSMLAYKYSTTRFVKLHHEIAEMETVQIPAVLAYKGGDICATISDAKAEGLEETLRKVNILR